MDIKDIVKAESKDLVQTKFLPQKQTIISETNLSTVLLFRLGGELTDIQRLA